jgi:hypothetical protein
MNPTQEAFILIQRLGEICATHGIDADTQKRCNEIIQSLLDKIIKPSVQAMTSKAAGIIV